MLSRLTAALALLATGTQAVSVVKTDLGAVQGYTNDEVDIWRGIPFAAPPTGDLRFRRPQPASPWSDVRDATTQQGICPQVRLSDFVYLGNEDCLYLDVYSPANRQDPLPVFVWFFGGGYVFGDGWEFGFYDGTNLAKKKDMIIVTLNYRLGPLGMMALDQLTDEDADGTSGNMALHDQRAALQWVQRNIAAFGGDPNRVTIGGESAGAFSVCWHIASPGSAGLFQAAILESGTCEAPEFFVPRKDQVSWSRAYASMVGCDPNILAADELLPCLRALPTGEIMGHLIGHQASGEKFSNVSLKLSGSAVTITEQQQNWAHNMHANFPADAFQPLLYPVMAWGTTIDGTDQGLPDLPITLIKAGKFTKVPMIMGTNNNEGNIFVPLLKFAVPNIHFPLRQADLTVAFDHFFNSNATVVASILAQYPLYQFPNAEDDASVILRDYFFFCAARNTLSTANDWGVPTWLYHYTYPSDWIDGKILGDYHSAELPFVFANPWPRIIHKFSDSDQQMADTFNDYWSNLIHFGNPNGNGVNPPAMLWPQYNASSAYNVVLDVPPAIEAELVKSKCEFWNQLNTNGY